MKTIPASRASQQPASRALLKGQRLRMREGCGTLHPPPQHADQARISSSSFGFSASGFVGRCSFVAE